MSTAFAKDRLAGFGVDRAVLRRVPQTPEQLAGLDLSRGSLPQ